MGRDELAAALRRRKIVETLRELDRPRADERGDAGGAPLAAAPAPALPSRAALLRWPAALAAIALAAALAALLSRR